MHLREVICTSKDGDRFWRMPEAYVRGNTVKFIRMSEETLELAKQSDLRREERRAMGASRGRGRGRGRSGAGRDGGRGGGRD
jgi:U6 snRNA-associated Sm-like protein LSm4